MSGSNRGGNTKVTDWAFPLTGIVLGLVLAWGIGWLQTREEYNRKQTPAAYADAAKKDAESACIGIEPRAFFECVNKKTETAYQTAHDEQDLSAQQRAASSALITAVLSGLALALSGVGVWYVKRTLDATLEAVEDTGKATKAMERQNELAEDTAKRQLRAYVTTEDHATINFQIGVKAGHQCKVYNRGQTPAYDVRIWSRPVAIITTEGDVHKTKVFRQETFAQSSATLGPGQWIGHTNALSGPLTNDSFVSLCVGGIAIVWGGIVSYRDAFGRQRRTTFKYYCTGIGEALPPTFDMTACSRGNAAN